MRKVFGYLTGLILAAVGFMGFVHISYPEMYDYMNDIIVDSGDTLRTFILEDFQYVFLAFLISFVLFLVFDLIDLLKRKSGKTERIPRVKKIRRGRSSSTSGSETSENSSLSSSNVNIVNNIETVATGAGEDFIARLRQNSRK